MAFGFTDLTPEGKRYFEQLKQLVGLEIRVGYQAGKDSYDDGTELTDVAAYNEFGASDRPPRPFMKQSFENHQKELRAAGEQMNANLAHGMSAQQALNRYGVIVKGLIQQEIVDGGFAPNAPSTIKSKGSEQPLIDTGHMRQSVNYVIEPKGSGSK